MCFLSNFGFGFDHIQAHKCENLYKNLLHIRHVRIRRTKSASTFIVLVNLGRGPSFPSHLLGNKAGGGDKFTGARIYCYTGLLPSSTLASGVQFIQSGQSNREPRFSNFQ